MARLSKHPHGYIHKPSGLLVRKVECANGRAFGKWARHWRNCSIHWVISKNGKRLDSTLTLKKAREKIDALQS